MASASKAGEGVHDSYKQEAKKGCDVLFRCTIKGRSKLVDDIPLHMSVKIFKSPSEFDIEDLKKFVEENDVVSPDPKTLEFKPIIFKAEFSGLEYYMLKIEGLGPQYKALYDKYSHVGNVYKNFMTHITIDKAIYDDVKENGLKPEEITFSKLMIEHGANNAAHVFAKSENHKGIPKVATALALVGALVGSPSMGKEPKTQSVTQSAYSSKKMLNTIASVESMHGKFKNHKPLTGINNGESAVGKYALTPNVIRETIHMHKELGQKYKAATKLRGDDMRRYVEDNPGLEDAVAQKHLQRLEHHFGQNPSKIGYAWLNGIRGMYSAGKQKKDINSHWHVLKIKEAYDKEK